MTIAELEPAVTHETTVHSQGLSALPGVLKQAGSRSVLLITGESQRHVACVRPYLAGLNVEVFAGARQHVPESVVAEADRRLRSHAADTIITLGGGSSIGLGKALRLEHRVHFIAIPSTYSGSERTQMYGTTAAAKKNTGRDPRVRPDSVIYDVELTLDMSKALTVTSLLNALAHPLSTLGTNSLEGEAKTQAFSAIEAVYSAIENLLQAPHSRVARVHAQLGAGLAAQALEAGRPGLQHSLVHRLGGRFNLNHSGLHSVLLPHTVRRLRDENPEFLRQITEHLRVPDFEGTLFDFLVRGGVGTSLKSLGLELAELDACFGEEPELTRELVSAAFHGRRPSADTRYEAWQGREPVSVSGPELALARRVVVAIHANGQSADEMLGRTLEMLGNDPTVSVVAPQARDNSWYLEKSEAAPAEPGSEVEGALHELGRVLRTAAERSAAERVVLFGFGAGASLAIELFLRANQRFAALVAVSGGALGGAGESASRDADTRATPVLLAAASGDAVVSRGGLERARALLVAAGCDVTYVEVPGKETALHAWPRILARDFLRGERSRSEFGGFGNFHETEALPGALPRDRNSPRKSAYGLYPEQINATGFVAPRADNRRSWTYRIRPAAQHTELKALAHPSFRSDFSEAAPEPNLVGFAPRALPAEPTDFVDGMATIGGAGSARLRRGFAVHVYVANRGMEERAFYDADGDLLLVPELGKLAILTEFGVIEVEPGQIAILPRGVRFSVLLREPAARGYLAEVFGRHFVLPERGPVGANGLSEARHFRAPSAWHEDRLTPGYRLTAKLGGELYTATQDYSPFDVVAWHGNHYPCVYDLAAFSPVNNTRIDHGDPSVYSVLSAPLDEEGSNTLDFVVFPARWDATENTFRPPFFHRNVTSEFNGIVREPGSHDAMFVPGAYFLTPAMTPHGVRAAGVERALRQDDTLSDRPEHLSRHSLWFQFETALPFCLSRWARESKNKIADWHQQWGAYRPHFSPRQR